MTSIMLMLTCVNYQLRFRVFVPNYDFCFFVFQAGVVWSRVGLRVLLLMHLRGVVPLFGGGHFWRLAEHGQQGRRLE